MPFPERIRSLALAGQVLVVGSTEGRLFLWEVSSVSLTPLRVLPYTRDTIVECEY